MSSRLTTVMGDCPLSYRLLTLPSHPVELSLAIRPWVGVMSIGDGLGKRFDTDLVG